MPAQLTKRLLKKLVDTKLYSSRLREAYERKFAEAPMGIGLMGMGLQTAYYATNVVQQPVPKLEEAITSDFGAIGHYLTYFPEREETLRELGEKASRTLMHQGRPIGEERYWYAFNSSVNNAIEMRRANEEHARWQALEDQENGED